MELRVLKYFLAVAREQSISKAASSVYVTQPTLSRQIMDLEDELGATLFIRSKHNKAVFLTEDGKRLYEYAREIVSLAEKTVQEFHAESEHVDGDIYIGAGETDAMRIVARAAKSLSQKYPRIRYHLFSGSAETISNRLDKGLIDFGIFVGEVYVQRYNYLTLNKKDRWGVWIFKDSPLAEKPNVSPDDLKDVPLFIPLQSKETNELAGWFGASYEKLHIAGTYNLLYNASLMAEEGLGAVISIDKLLHPSADSPLVFVPFNPPLEARLILAWRKSSVFSPAAKLFLDAVKSVNG